jgi:hypothetical protein
LAWAARCVVCLPNAELSASTNDFGGRGHRRLLPCVHRRPPLERSLPPSYAPRVLAFKLDLDAFPFLHRSCPCQSEQPSELFIFRVSAPDEGQHGRERSSGKVGKRCRGGSHLFVRDHVPNYLFARRGRPRPPTKSDFWPVACFSVGKLSTELRRPPKIRTHFAGENFWLIEGSASRSRHKVAVMGRRASIGRRRPRSVMRCSCPRCSASCSRRSCYWL